MLYQLPSILKIFYYVNELKFVTIEIEIKLDVKQCEILKKWTDVNLLNIIKLEMRGKA